MSFQYKLGHVLTYFWSFDLLRSVEGGHHGLSFGKISEKVTDNFLSKLAFTIN